ncbi:MAG: hypothetical protein JJT96_03930 [Opitutales bacterium]|nr:hypothetical protein [Opitutales bacterium]
MKSTAFEIEFLEGIVRRESTYVEALEMLATLYTKSGRLDEGLRIDRKLVAMQPENATHHYNLACSLALKNQRARAVTALRKAISLGYDDFQWMLTDEDLKPLRGHPRFIELMEELQSERRL